MKNNRILTIQDISCVGQCSLTVALPIISACGIEACPLPSAVLSTHTGGSFSGYTFRDLTEDFPGICAHWKKQGIDFDIVYSGYLGSKRQVSLVGDIMRDFGSLSVVDPAMADNGRLYGGFDGEFVEAMRPLCAAADIILPNITEACLLTGIKYRESYDEGYIRELLAALSPDGRTVILTGVSLDAGTTGVAVYDGSDTYFYRHERFDRCCHGTGDIYASVVVGALARGKSVADAAKIAADFTVLCIKNTAGDSAHWYGVRFEPMLGRLIEMLK